MTPCWGGILIKNLILTGRFRVKLTTPKAQINTDCTLKIYLINCFIYSISCTPCCGKEFNVWGCISNGESSNEYREKHLKCKK